MRIRTVGMRTACYGLLAIVLLAAAPGTALAQAPEPPAAGNSQGSFPWLALLLFVAVAAALTMYRSHPNYPKKPTGNT